MAISKRQRQWPEGIDATQSYTVDDGLALLKEAANTKFSESVDVAVRLGVDPRKSDQIVRGAVTLPHGLGKKVRVAVFADGEQAQAAQDAGADIVGTDDLAADIQKGELNFDVVIAVPQTMALVGKLGQILGPRGLMPNPKVGTVTDDVATAVKNAKSGQVRYRNDKAGIVHCTIGRADFPVASLRENLQVLIEALRKAKPSSAKGIYLKKISVSTTMGPGLTVDTAGLA